MKCPGQVTQTIASPGLAPATEPPQKRRHRSVIVAPTYNVMAPRQILKLNFYGPGADGNLHKGDHKRKDKEKQAEPKTDFRHQIHIYKEEKHRQSAKKKGEDAQALHPPNQCDTFFKVIDLTVHHITHLPTFPVMKLPDQLSQNEEPIRVRKKKKRNSGKQQGWRC